MVGLARRSFYDVSPGLVPTADQKLIVGLEKWRGFVLTVGPKAHHSSFDDDQLM